MDILNNYMVQGILESKIFADGGPECYQEIPKIYHIIATTIFVIMHYYIIKYWSYSLTDKEQKLHHEKKSNWIEKFVAVNGIISLALTLYYKLYTRKGMFIFNPCHLSLLILVFLLFAPTTKFTRKVHTCWTAWLFGAIMALGIPHLEGVSQFQVYNYYFEHILITPIGPIILYRRYGYVLPTFKNQLVSFGTIIIYQLGLLVPLGLITTINLNFSLCHSPFDPFYEYVGYHYFSGAVFFLNLCSYIARWLNYLLVLPLKLYFDKYKVKSEKQASKIKNMKRE